MTVAQLPDDVCSCGHTRHAHNPDYGDECWASEFAPTTCVCSGFEPAENPTQRNIIGETRDSKRY